MNSYQKPTLHPIEASWLHARRERVFLLLAGLFLGSLTMLNILGISRFIKLFSIGNNENEIIFAVAIGVLPYPITFLCTDFISEFYGRKRANSVVWMGFLLNLWVVFILWVGGSLPGFEPMKNEMIIPDLAGRLPVFFEIRQLALGGTVASMAAYLIAQFCDVKLFHFWKKLTNGKHIWLRNNASTLVSQLIDTVAVILITYWLGGLSMVLNNDTPILNQLSVLIATGYLFKALCALIDTIPFYIGSKWLKKYIKFDPVTGENIG